MVDVAKRNCVRGQCLSERAINKSLCPSSRPLSALQLDQLSRSSFANIPGLLSRTVECRGQVVFGMQTENTSINKTIS